MKENIRGPLEQQLKAYTEKNQIPMHMPGHKRRISVTSAVDSSLDFTEVEETDDLHHASGILKDAMARTAQLYGAERTWYLVNGSTCGNLAGVFALTHEGDEIIAARNLHRSLFHAFQLRNLKVHWLMPPYLKDYETYGSLNPEDVKEAIRKYPSSRAVILTSPTYEGIISDIRSISAAAHDHGIPVFVDEAHGPHLGFDAFPQGALQAGADLVVQSPHKTLFSATGTAWLHLKGNRVKPEEVEKQLGIFETSSPSYPLLMSLDGCSTAWAAHHQEYTESWLNNIRLFEEETVGMRHMRILEHPAVSRPDISAFDPGKLLIHSSIPGSKLAAILHDQYRFTMEMAVGHNVLAMTSAADDPEEILHFAKALQDIDARLPDEDTAASLPVLALSDAAMTIHDAVEAEHRSVPIDEAAGLTAGEYLFLYPPGIPFIIPGEVIQESQIAVIHEAEHEGCEVRSSESEPGDIAVIR